MIKFEHTEVMGWSGALRGMRNPMNSWARADSYWLISMEPEIGPNDAELALKLTKAGRTHAKYRRMIHVQVDITAPLYWWKEMDTYAVGVVKNSCSTMHKIQAKEFELNDFSHENLNGHNEGVLAGVVAALNEARAAFNQTRSKDCWWQMIQLLPSSYNQLRTVDMSYEVMANIYETRRGHKLDEWVEYCKWIEALPYSWMITTSGKE